MEREELLTKIRGILDILSPNFLKRAVNLSIGTRENWFLELFLKELLRLKEEQRHEERLHELLKAKNKK